MKEVTEQTKRREILQKVNTEMDGFSLPLTIGKYKLFLEYRDKGGIDAMNLYLHLLFTGINQKTNQPHATNSYIMWAFGWGKTRLIKAKNLLKKFGLIEIIQKFKENGKFDKKYIKVLSITPLSMQKEISDTQRRDQERPACPTPGVPNARRVADHKCLKEEDKYLKEEDKYLREQVKYTGTEVPVYQNISPVNENISPPEKELGPASLSAIQFQDNVIAYWQEKIRNQYMPNPRPMTDNAEQKARKYLGAMRNGALTRMCTNITSDWARREELPIEYTNGHKWTEEEIKHAIDNYSLQFQPGYYPDTKEKKQKQTKNLPEFIYAKRNPHCPSLIIKLFVKPPKQFDNPEPPNQEYYEMVKSMLFENSYHESKLSEQEDRELRQIMVDIDNEWGRMWKKIGQYYAGSEEYQFRWNYGGKRDKYRNFLERYCRMLEDKGAWMLDQGRSLGVHQLRVGSKSWQDYMNYIRDEDGCYLQNPDFREITRAKSAYRRTQEMYEKEKTFISNG
ncbi:MAG: hypothetical protein SVO01_02925 [Thermotogota bacterium]|nr:hypothetical protein [Thermotogota bacterium]